MSSPINLARDPFLNTRLVVRFRQLAWLVGAALLGLNVVLFMQNRRDSTDLREQIRSVRAKIEDEDGEIDRLRATLRRLRPEDQAAQVLFLNQKIRQRTFPWGELFDHIGEVLPRNVRLTSLDPRVASERGVRSRTPVVESQGVELAVDGVAANDQQLYSLLDAFFEHSAFAEPRLAYENRNDNGSVSFSLRVGYLPSAGSTATEGSADTAGATADSPSAAQTAVTAVENGARNAP